MITSAERERALKDLEESCDRLTKTVRGLSSAQLHYRSAPDRWTIAEILEHLTCVEARVLGLVQKSLSEGPAPSKRSAMANKEEEFVGDVAGRVTRFQAPEPVRPTGRWSDDRLLTEFEAARKQTREFVASTDAELRQHFFPHTIFGELDLYQWLLLVSAHCDRHRAQSEEVMAHAAYPQSSAAASHDAHH